MNDKMTDDAHERILRLKEGDRMGLIDADKIPWRGDYVSDYRNMIFDTKTGVFRKCKN